MFGRRRKQTRLTRQQLYEREVARAEKVRVDPELEQRLDKAWQEAVVRVGEENADEIRAHDDAHPGRGGSQWSPTERRALAVKYAAIVEVTRRMAGDDEFSLCDRAMTGVLTVAHDDFGATQPLLMRRLQIETALTGSAFVWDELRNTDDLAFGIVRQIIGTLKLTFPV